MRTKVNDVSEDGKFD